MRIHFDFTEDYTLIRLHGRLTYATETHFKTVLSLDNKTHHHVVMDCTNLDYMDSTGLGMLVGLARTLEPEFGLALKPVKLCNMNQQIRHILRTTRFDQYFPIYDSLEDAIAAMPQKTLLIVSDESDFIQLLRAMLGVQERYDVMVAQGAGNVMAIMSQKKVDLVLFATDACDRAGDVLEAICAQHDVPVLLLSQKEYGTARRDANIKACIQRPFDTVDFLQRIEDALAGSR